MKIRRAMLFCIALLFILSLGFSAASAADSNGYGNMELNQGLPLSDSISVDDGHFLADSISVDDGHALSDSIDEDMNIQNNAKDSIESNDEDIDDSQLSDSKEYLQSNIIKDGSNVIYVSPDGNDENDGLTRDTPVGNISTAVSLAGEGDSIYLLSGVYNQDKNTQLSKNLYFTGEDGAVINRTAKFAVFTYTSDNIKTVSFKNIIFISEVSDATNPIFSMAGRANLICDNCTFTHIISNKNGVIRFIGNSTGLISNCRFIDLDGTSNGGASYIYVLGEAKVRVDRSVFKNISNAFLRAVVYVNNDLANLTLSNSHFYNISGNANSIVENRGYMKIANSTFNDIALSGNSPVGIIWTSETISKNSRTYINSSSFYNNSISTTAAVNSSMIQAKAPVVVEYSSFMYNVADFIVNNDNKTDITANYNWWGTNDNPKSLVSDDVTIDNWFIMSVDFDTSNLIAGEEYPIAINFNQITNEDGESYYLDEGINGVEIIVSSQNGRFIVNDGNVFNGVPLGGGTLEDDGRVAKVYTENGLVNLVYAPVIDGAETISFKSDHQEFRYNIELSEAIAYEEFYVSKSGNDENDGLSNATAFKTINHAIETAKSSKLNAKIHISSGVYEENGFEIVSYGEGFERPHFIFIGSGNVAIDGKGEGTSIFAIRDGAVSFKNIRFTNVNGAENGGAINIALNDEELNNGNGAFVDYYEELNNGDGAFIDYEVGNDNSAFVNLTINNCTFDNLSVNGNGGAISYNEAIGKIIINNTRFNGLSANTGGALYIKEGNGPANLKVTGSKFKENSASNAAALYLELSNVTIGNCDFANNSATNAAGAILFNNSNALVENCTIVNGSSKKEGAAVLIDGADENRITIKNSIIENNSAEESADGIGEDVPAIYLIGGALNISYSSIVNDLSLETAAVESGSGIRQGVVIGNNNWWGTNNPNETVKGSNITIDQWLIMHLTLNNTGVLKVGNTVNISIDFNHVMTSSGEILLLTGGKISREFALRLNATAGRAYPNYIITRNKEANSIFTVEDGGACLDVKTDNALVHIDFIVNNYYGVIYVSNDGNDDWNGSLESPVRSYEKALSLALEEGGSHHIFFLEGTYEFCDVNIDETYLTIEGEGIDKSILDGVQYTGGMISSYESNLIIKNITLKNGANTLSSGGTITNMGNLTLDTVKISDSIVKNANGGAIYSVGQLTIINSTFSNNLVDNGASGGNGGVIYTDGYYTSLDYPPSLEIYDSTFIGNTAKGSSFGGGAIYMQVVNGNKVIKNTKFISNKAVAGGAIFLQRCEGDFIMDNLSFIGNAATGSSSYYGGGAICLIGISDSRVGNVIITNSLFENNSAKGTRGGGAIFDRNVDLNISNSAILNNRDTEENIQIFKDATIYLPSGGRITLEDNWWGANDLSALSNLPSNATIDRWVVMELSAELYEESDSPSNLNEYLVKAHLDKYNDGTSIEENLNYQSYSNHPFERVFSFDSSTGSFNPASGILTNNLAESIFSSNVKDNTIRATIDNQTLEFNTMDLYIDTVIGLSLESDKINARYANLTIDLHGIDSNPINGILVLNIDGNDETLNFTDGKATVELKGLNEGINNITVIFYGKGKYLESENSCLIEVNLIKASLSASVDDAIDEGSGNLTALLTDADGVGLAGKTVWMLVGGYNLSAVSDEEGIAYMDLSGLAPGIYKDVEVFFDGDDYCSPSSDTVTIIVKKLPVETHIDAFDVTIDEGTGNLTAVLTADGVGALEGKTLSIVIAGETLSAVTDAEGAAVIDLSDVAAGLYEDLLITFAGDDDYLASSTPIALTVNEVPGPIGTYIDAEDVTVDAGFGNLTAVLYDEDGVGIEGKTITLDVNGESLSASTNEFGQAVFDLSGLAPGTYENVEIAFAGDDDYDSSATAVTITVNEIPGPIGTYIDASDVTAIVDSGKLTAVLAAEGVGPLAGRIVTAHIDYILSSAVTDAEGVAVFDLGGIPAGIYKDVEIRFAGGGDYLGSKTTVTVTINKIETVLEAFDDEVGVGSGNFSAALSVDGGDALAGETLLFNIGTLSALALTNEDGVATVDLSGLAVGTYTAFVNYFGDNLYAGDRVEATVTVTKAKRTAQDLQELIDNAPEGSILDLGEYEYEDVSDVNITKDITLMGNNTTIVGAGDGSPIFNVAPKSESGPKEVNIENVEFKVKNGDIIVKAAAENGTDPSSIDVASINIARNTITKANDDVVGESVTVLALESERGILSPTGNITIVGNAIDAGVKPFKFDVTSIGSGNDIHIVPQNITPALEKIITEIDYEDMVTDAVNTAIEGRVGEYFKVVLKDSTGKLLADKAVQIGFNGKIYNRTTDENGSCKLQINLPRVDIYTFAVSFLGDEEYNGSFIVAKITVNAQKGSLTVPNKSYAASAKTKSLTATLKTKGGKVIKGKKISFTVNGKTYSATTNAKGVATVNVSLNKKGTYNFTAKFTGDKTYAAITKAASLTIK